MNWLQMKKDTKDPYGVHSLDYVKPGEVLVNEIPHDRSITITELRDIAISNALAIAETDTSPLWVNTHLMVAGKGITKNYVQSSQYSGCGLIAEGLLRLLGAPIPSLYEPYRIGTAIGRVIRWARRNNQWKTSGKILEGSYVVIGARSEGEAYGGTEHAFTLVHADEDSGEFLSVDGGQPSQYGDAIRLRGRTFDMRRGHSVLVDSNGSWRRILGWYDPCLNRYK